MRGKTFEQHIVPIFSNDPKIIEQLSSLESVVEGSINVWSPDGRLSLNDVQKLKYAYNAHIMCKTLCSYIDIEVYELYADILQHQVKIKSI